MNEGVGNLEVFRNGLVKKTCTWWSERTSVFLGCCVSSSANVMWIFPEIFGLLRISEVWKIWFWIVDLNFWGWFIFFPTLTFCGVFKPLLTGCGVWWSRGREGDYLWSIVHCVVSKMKYRKWNKQLITMCWAECRNIGSKNLFLWNFCSFAGNFLKKQQKTLASWCVKSVLPFKLKNGYLSENSRVRDNKITFLVCICC